MRTVDEQLSDISFELLLSILRKHVDVKTDNEPFLIKDSLKIIL